MNQNRLLSIQTQILSLSMHHKREITIDIVIKTTNKHMDQLSMRSPIKLRDSSFDVWCYLDIGFEYKNIFIYKMLHAHIMGGNHVHT